MISVLILCLLPCIFAANNSRSDAPFCYKPWQKWIAEQNPPHIKQILPDFQSPTVTDHRMTKDGTKGNCPEGYTGPLCQYPMCKVMGHAPPYDNDDGFGNLVDAEFYAVCKGSQYLPVDGHMHEAIYINLDTSDAGTLPSLVLKDPLGQVVDGTVVSSSNFHVVMQYLNVLPGPHTVEYNADAGCMILVTAMTDLTVTPGFVKTLQSDDARFDLPEYEPYVFVGSVNGMCTPGELTYLQVYEQSVLVYRSAAQKRYGCAFENFFGLITCDSLKEYYYKIYGMDEFGYTFVRLDLLFCVQGQLTTQSTGSTGTTGSTVSGSSTTTSPGGHFCQHGGTPTIEGHCFCQPYYTGFYCESVMCLNGGTEVRGACFCPIGYGGQFCEHVHCDVEETHFNTSHRSLNFVMMNRQTMSQDKQQMIYAAMNISAYYNSLHPGYFIDWTLTTFVDRTVVTHFFTNEHDFMVALNNSVPLVNSTNCDHPTLGALEKLYNNVIFPRSPVFVFTDSHASDYSEMTNIMHTGSFWKMNLFFIVSTPPNTINCPLNSEHPGYKVYDQLAQFTHGHVVRLEKAQIAEFLTGFAPTLFMMNTLLLGDFASCNDDQEAYTPLFIDGETHQVYITTTGVALALELKDPLGASTTLTPVFSMGNAFIYSMNKTEYSPGPYLMKLRGHSGTACTYRALAHSNLDLFVGYSTTVIQDHNEVFPRLGQPAHVVVHVNNQEVFDQTRLDTEALIYTNAPTQHKYLYMSTGRYRDQCNYKLYYGPWTCMTENQMFYITVYADDNQGHTFQRTTTGFCNADSGSLTTTTGSTQSTGSTSSISTLSTTSGSTTTPLPGTCQNGGVMYNGTCVCPTYFEGDECEKYMCLNGGTTNGNSCQCSGGFSGAHCESYMCVADQNRQKAVMNVADFDPNGRSLAFLIQNSATMAMDMNEIKEYVDQFVQEIKEQHPGWLTKFMLMTFNDKRYDMLANTASADEFAKAVHTIEMDTSGVQECEKKTLDAVNQALDEGSKYGLIFVFTDKAVNFTFNDSAMALDKLGKTKAQLNFFITSQTPCGDPFETPATRIMIDLAEFSAGSAYVTEKNMLKDLLRVMPTRYESGLVYETSVADCTQEQTLYFPADSHTDSLMIEAIGNQPNLSYIGGDLKPLQPLTIIDDSRMLRIDQIIKLCGEGFDSREQYCYHFVKNETMDFVAAREFCREKRARLITILSPEEQIYLDAQVSGIDYWTGLNDVTEEGTWVWDNQHAPQPLGPFDNWANGQPGGPDPSQNCVEVHHADGSKGEWVVADCSLKKPFICEKHRYDPDHFSPETILGGIYQVKVVTQPSPSGADNGCVVKVRAQSAIQLYHGFTQDPNTDTPSAEPHVSSAADNLMLAHMAGMQGSGRMTYMHIYWPNGTLTDAARIHNRVGCDFDKISDPFSCPAPHAAFRIVTGGMDDRGYFYQRTANAVCVQDTDTPVSCLHGGVLYQDKCICSEWWEGIRCERAVCTNGGHVMANGSCDCLPGFNGEHCEFATCQRDSVTTTASPGGDPDFSITNRSLVLVLDSTVSMQYVIQQQLKPNMLTWLNKLEADHPGWFHNYILVPVHDPPKGVRSEEITVTDDKATFAEAVNRIVAENGQECPNPLMEGLMAALNIPELRHDSLVFVLTQAVPIDYNMAPSVMDMVSNTGAQVNFVVAGSDNPCGSEFHGPAATAMRNVAEMSRGSIYSIAATDTMNFMNTFMPTKYSSSIMAQSADSLLECKNTHLYFPVDFAMNGVTIDIFGWKATAVLRDAAGNQTSYQTLLSSPRTTLLQFSPSQGAFGLWQLTVNSQGGPCLVQVRGRSPLDISLAYTLGDIHSDQGAPVPSANASENIMLLHHSMDNSLLEYVQWWDRGNWQMLDASPLTRRQGCAYQYYTKPFACPADNSYVSISGRDAMNVPFRRITSMHCPAKQPPKCETKTRTSDVAFVIDSSFHIGPHSFEKLKSFVSDFVGKYTIGSDRHQTQFSLTTMSAVAKPFSNFDAYNTLPKLRQAISSLFYDAMPGQDIHGVLGKSLELLQPGSGLRSSADHHMVVVFSSVGWTGGDPTPLAQTLRDHGVNVVAVGVGTNADMAQMRRLAAGERCATHIVNVDDGVQLQTLAQFLMDKTCSASSLFC